MSRPTQLLLLEPNDVLNFRGSEEDCKSSLGLTNPTPYPICFKVKTTASRKYCVRPKTGLLLPYSRREVCFRLREGCRDERDDRFKILSSVKPADAKGTDPALLWSFVLESACMQSKLGVSIQKEDKPQMEQSTCSKIFRRVFVLLVFLSALSGLGLTYIKVNY